jgi:hypothetical protein
MQQLGIWYTDWLIGAVMTIGTVVLHVVGLALIHRIVLLQLARAVRVRAADAREFILVLTPAVALAFMLHALEAFSWAMGYVMLGALETWRAAVIYSLGALSTYGHAGVFLAPEWQLLGAIQALNGMLVFGLTIGFLAAVIRQTWSGAPI